MKTMLKVVMVLAVVAGAMLLDQALGSIVGVGGMLAVTNLIASAHPRLENYIYPTGTRVLVLQDDTGPVHLIFVAVDVTALLTATDGTGYGNAPIGSVVYQNLAGTARIHQKDTAGAWDSVTLS